MARRDRRSGPQPQVRGFRPGKEPAHLRKEQAKRQLAGDVSGAQEKLMDLFAERGPDRSRALIRRWQLGLLIGAIALGVLGVALYFWSVVAGVVVHILAVGVLFLWWQIRRKQADLEAVADLVGGRQPGGRGGRKGKRRGR